MKTLVIGAGQVGSAIHEVIKPFNQTFIKDVEPLELEGVEVLQICYPDHPGFVETTKAYIDQYKPIFAIVNSSVEVGTTEKIGPDVVYSPVRGRHPNLAPDIRVYTKIVSGKNPKKVEMARQYFQKCGLTVLTDDNPQGIEFCKLISNIHMGLEIAWRQEVERMLKTFNVSPEVYETWEKTYNDGYMRVGQYHLMRPMMRPDPIGGHCILPCTEILSNQFKSQAFDFILESNEKAKKEQAGGKHAVTV